MHLCVSTPTRKDALFGHALISHQGVRTRSKEKAHGDCWSMRILTGPSITR
jgi:hypothetical protein